jgi:D-serine deaminase-like pyridoxal phosphate-dependent protein
VLRPHVKTAKSVEVTQRALDAPAGAICVSTVREAEYYFDHGFRDILYAVGLVSSKVPRLAELVKRGAQVRAIVDSVEAAEGLSVASARRRSHPGVDRDRQRRPSRGRASRRRRALEVAAALGTRCMA